MEQIANGRCLFVEFREPIPFKLMINVSFLFLCMFPTDEDARQNSWDCACRHLQNNPSLFLFFCFFSKSRDVRDSTAFQKRKMDPVLEATDGKCSGTERLLPHASQALRP